jgi:hypothetical protein
LENNEGTTIQQFLEPSKCPDLPSTEELLFNTLENVKPGSETPVFDSLLMVGDRQKDLYCGSKQKKTKNLNLHK